MQYPPFFVEIIEFFSSNILLEVYSQQSLYILPAVSSGGKAVLPQSLFNAVKIGKNLFFLEIPYADYEQEFPCRSRLRLNVVEEHGVLFKQLSDSGIFLFFRYSPQIVFVALKALAAVHAEYLYFRQTLENGHQRVYFGGKVFFGKYGNIAGLNAEKNHLRRGGLKRIFRYALNAYELPCSLTFLFRLLLLFFLMQIITLLKTKIPIFFQIGTDNL